MNKKELYQAHAMVFAIQYPHDCSQELTPWWWYEKACDLFCVEPQMNGYIHSDRRPKIPRIELKTKLPPKSISENYQAIKFCIAIDFMLLMCSEEQYEFVISRARHSSEKESLSSQEHELQCESSAALVPEKMAT